jgi:hypothetical protein
MPKHTENEMSNTSIPSASDVKAKAQEISDKANEIKARINDSVTAQQQRVKESLSNVQDRLATYGNQIGEYLKSIDADVQDYRFAIEKTGGDSLSVDVLFKAKISLNNSTES